MQCRVRRFSRIASCSAFDLPLYLLANRSNRNSRIMRSILGLAEALADILMPYGMMSTWGSDLGAPFHSEQGPC